MRNTLRRWLHDISIRDPVARQQALTFQILLIGMLVAAIVDIPINFFTAAAGDRLRATLPILMAALVIAGTLVLLRRGYFHASALVTAIGLLVVITVLLIARGLAGSGVLLFAFALPLTLVGLLSSRALLLLTSGLIAAIVFAVFLLQRSSPPLAGLAPYDDTAIVEIVATFLLNLVVLSLFLDRFGASLRDALAASLTREQELDHSRTALEARSAELEREVAGRERVEAALRDSEAQYRNLFENNPHPMWVYDSQTLRFLAVNDAAIQCYGYTREQFLALTIEQIRPSEDVPALRNTLATLSTDLKHSGTWRHSKQDGTIIEVEITSHGLVFDGRSARLVLVHDITDRKKLEAQFLRAQRMEGIGRLAGGVAHDFNNLLTAIMGNLELALDTLPSDHIVYGDLTEAQKAANRAAGLTRQLLAFARKQPIEPHIINLNHLIAEMDKLLRRLIGEDIELVTLPAANLAPIKADPGQIEQVIVNLAVNARDAMPDGGKLTIETRTVEIDQSYVQQHVGVTLGIYVLLAVSDTGIGMDAETQRQIFEPFFTTKPKGRGTGLGLATCYGIIKQHGGHIWPYSEPGHGSTFRIYLPLADEPVSAHAEHRHSDALPGGTETVLLAEDEAAVRVLAARVLRERGYTVLEASDGGEALRLAGEHGAAPIDLLLTDIVMPRVSGKALVEQVGAIHPHIKVLYISGYADHAVVHHGRLDPGVDFLHKPFSPSTLARKVREVLDA
jgi:PAS domain S-box-containing protein